jgi:hypothetical protein
MKKTNVIPFSAREREARKLSEAMKELPGVVQETRRLSRALGVTRAEIDADGANLYYHGQELLDIEAAYRESTASGRAALLDALFRYHDMGYAGGTADGQMVAHKR